LGVCELCQGERDEARWQLSNFDVLVCQSCDVLFIPLSQAGTTASPYTEDYFRARGMTQPEYVTAIRKMKRSTFARHFSVLARVCPDVQPRGSRLLDVGCAVGFLPELAKDLGYDAYGVEVSEHGARLANERLPGRVKAGTLQNAAYETASFDVVTSSDVIEHVPNPRDFLREVARITKPGGAVLLTTPDMNSLSARVFGKRWPNVKLEHLWYFSRKGLTRLLDQQGFDVVEVRAATKTATLDYGRRQFQANPRPLVTPLTGLVRFLPRRLRDQPIPIRIGDMLVIARRRR